MERNICSIDGLSVVKRYGDKEISKTFNCYKDLYDFIKGCDIVLFGGIEKLIERLRSEFITYDFRDVKVIDLLKVEEYIKPRNFSTVCHSYGCDNTIFSLLEAQTFKLSKSIRELDLISSGESKRLDVAGYLKIKDGIVVWAKGAHENKPIVKNIPYTQKILNSLPYETQEEIKKVFKR